ncbi:MAG: carboxypeptidase regulatory-like domain-containing protein [Thermoanaerobaculia bacterium]
MTVRVPTGLALPSDAALVAYSPWHQEPLTLGPVASSKFELPSAGTWTLQVRGTGIYSAPREVAIPGRADFELEPGVGLRAALVSEELQKLPSNAVVRVSRCGSRQPLGELVCPVSRLGKLSCTVPTGCLDLRTRVRGFVAHYAWGQASERDGVDLGALLLVPGASIAGSISTEDGRALDASATVRARLQRFGVERKALGAGQAQDELEVKPDSRGFFQISELAAANYEVVASQKGYQDAVASRVAVREGLETALLAPLTLSKPRSASIQLDPALGPAGEPWRVRLDQMDPTGILPIDTKVADELGFVEFPQLAPGKYGVLILDGRSPAPFLTQEIEVAEPSQTFFVTLDLLPLEGIVTLGGEALPEAEIKFSGGQGPKTARFTTDSKGRFRGALPSAGIYGIAISADSPPLQRSLLRREVRKPKGKSTAEIEIDLTDGQIEGEVVDESSNGVRDALVELRPEGPDEAAIAARADRDGKFSFRGLPQGSVTIRAASDSAESETQVVEVSEDLAAEVRLVVRPKRRVRGSVADSFGPVAAATTFVREFGGVLNRGEEVLSAVDGSFAVSLPREVSMAHVRVGAPGRSMYLRRHDLNDANVRVDLSIAGGAVEVLYPPESWKSVFFLHGGASEWFGPFQAWAALNEADGGLRDFANGRLVVPRLGPGPWSVCLVDPGSPEWISVHLLGTPVPSACRSFTSEPGSFSRVDLRVEPTRKKK